MTGFDWVANGRMASLLRWGNLTREERFWAKVVKTAGCWMWTGANDNHGYGVCWDGTLTDIGNKRAIKAHRFAYELVKGKIPEGLTIDHLCRNRMCVNPEHLEAVTMRINSLRGVGIPAINAKKTVCKRGHLLSGDNLNPHRKGRICRVCERLMAKQWRERHKHD